MVQLFTHKKLKENVYKIPTQETLGSDSLLLLKVLKGHILGSNHPGPEWELASI